MEQLSTLEIQRLKALQEKKDSALELARETLSFVPDKAPYDGWGSNPISLALKIRIALNAIEEVLK